MRFAGKKPRWIPTTSPFIWDGDFSHGRDDSIHLSFCASFPPLEVYHSWSGGLPSLGSGLNSLFYQDPCPSATKSQCHSQLDRSLCGYCSSSFDLSVVGNQRDCFISLLVIGFGLTFLLYPLIYHDLKQSPLPSHLLGQEGIYCAPFSLLLAALVRVGGASLPTWFLLIMVVASQGFYFFVLTRLPKNDQRRFSTCFFSPDLSNSHHSDLFENGPRLVATAFLDSSRMAGNSSLSLDFSRCLRRLCGLSRGVGSHPFHWNLVTIMVRCTIRFVILYRKGIYEIHQRKALTALSPLSALVLFFMFGLNFAPWPSMSPTV